MRFINPHSPSSLSNFSKLNSLRPNLKHLSTISSLSPNHKHPALFSPTNTQSFNRPSPLYGVSSFRAYSSFFGVTSGGMGSDGGDSLKKVWQSTVDVVDFTGRKAKDTCDAVAPHVQQLLDVNPYMTNVIITLTGTFFAWLVMPRVLKKIHQSRAALMSKYLAHDQTPYEKSLFGSLEDPARYLITFIAFSQLAVMIAPTAIASQYLLQAKSGAIILSLVWFIHRWKTNALSRALSAQNIIEVDREMLLTLEKTSSVGIFILGSMALAEAYGVPVQSVLTVGGIGGVATAFAARDILMNVLSGFSMQFSKPFSLGDTIRAGSIEGEVIDVGLTTTSLLNADKCPVQVPNSLFLNQAIVNNSRAQLRAMVTKVPIQIDALEKIPQISNDIKTMLRSNPVIFSEKEAPYCVLSAIESSFAELTIGCNLKKMNKEGLYSAKQDILLKAARIINQHGASLVPQHTIPPTSSGGTTLLGA